MEFTQLVKKGAACLFLVLVLHGLVLGFSISTTVLSVVLAVIVFKMESELVLSERKESEKRIALITSQFEAQVIKLSEQRKLETEGLQEHLQNIKAQIGAMKMNNALTNRK